MLQRGLSSMVSDFEVLLPPKFTQQAKDFKRNWIRLRIPDLHFVQIIPAVFVRTKKLEQFCNT